MNNAINSNPNVMKLDPQAQFLEFIKALVIEEHFKFIFVDNLNCLRLNRCSSAQTQKFINSLLSIIRGKCVVFLIGHATKADAKKAIDYSVQELLYSMKGCSEWATSISRCVQKCDSSRHIFAFNYPS